MTGLAYGASLVARQEFRIRLRTGRWRWLLAGWFALVGAFTVLVDLALTTGYGYDTDTSRRGGPGFGLPMFFVLGLGMGVSPGPTPQKGHGDPGRRNPAPVAGH